MSSGSLGDVLSSHQFGEGAGSSPTGIDMEEVSKWKTAYERVVKENEQLKTRGGDVLVLQQWKQRYEACLQEKEDLLEKLKIYAKMNSHSSSGSLVNGAHGSRHSNNNEHPAVHGAHSMTDGKPIEQLYIDLKDEYKVSNICFTLASLFTDARHRNSAGVRSH
jgi:hypothetical protein